MTAAPAEHRLRGRWQNPGPSAESGTESESEAESEAESDSDAESEADSEAARADHRSPSRPSSQHRGVRSLIFFSLAFRPSIAKQKKVKGGTPRGEHSKNRLRKRGRPPRWFFERGQSSYSCGPSSTPLGKHRAGTRSGPEGRCDITGRWSGAQHFPRPGPKPIPNRKPSPNPSPSPLSCPFPIVRRPLSSDS